MKKIMENYAGATIAASVALSLFGILYSPSFSDGQNIWGYLGAIMKQAILTESVSVRMGEAFDEYKNRMAPTFTTPYCGDLQNGKIMPISWMMDATDSNGNRLNLQVLDCWNEDFGTTDSLIIMNQIRLRFYDSGVYWINVNAVDSNGYTWNVVTRVFANAR